MRSLMSLLLFTATSATKMVPPPTGPFSVAMKVQALTDTNRFETQNPNNHTAFRRVMVSVFLPVDKRVADHTCHTDRVPYMPLPVSEYYAKSIENANISPDTFSSFELELCGLAQIPSCAKGPSKKKYPVVLFSPGIFDSRLMYGAMARSLASNGYVVVTVDHPYETNFVEFPDGTGVHGIIFPTNDTIGVQKLTQIRTEDLSFVIDQLHNRTLTGPLLANYPGALDLQKIVVFGHSTGGAAAASVTRTDSRVLGGVDLDGWIIEPTLSEGFKKPFLIVGRPNHISDDTTWDTFWPRLGGSRMELAVNGTRHKSYTDGPLLMSGMDLPGPMKEALKNVLGTVEPRRLEKIINTVLMSFFDFVLYKNSKPLLELSHSFSEISVKRSNI